MRPKITAKLTAVWFIKYFWEKNIITDVESILEYIERKYGKKADAEKILEYSPDKKKDPELDKKVIKTIKNFDK